MKISTFIVLFSSLTIAANAQTFTIMPVGNKISFSNVNQVNIIGYEGKEVMFENKDYDHEYFNRASGLKLINSEIFDNTKIGLSVQNQGDVLIVKQVGNNDACNEAFKYIIKVPSNINIEYKHSSWDGDDLNINNISGEIEVSTNYNDIYLKAVTGPMAIKTVYGSIEVEFEELAQIGSVSLYSVYEYIDITLPENAQSSINLKTNHGNIYSDMDINILNEENTNILSNGDKIEGNLNGGGVDLIINANYDNIYLRKAK